MKKTLLLLAGSLALLISTSHAQVAAPSIIRLTQDTTQLVARQVNLGDEKVILRSPNGVFSLRMNFVGDVYAQCDNLNYLVANGLVNVGPQSTGLTYVFAQIPPTGQVTWAPGRRFTTEGFGSINIYWSLFGSPDIKPDQFDRFSSSPLALNITKAGKIIKFAPVAGANSASQREEVTIPGPIASIELQNNGEIVARNAANVATFVSGSRFAQLQPGDSIKNPQTGAISLPISPR